MANRIVTGFVARINTKTGSGKRGPWTLWSAALEDEKGNDLGWVSFGFEKPPINEGDYITGEVEDVNGQARSVTGTWSRPSNPPARATARPSASTGSGSSGGTEPSTGGSDSGANRQTQIVMQHSQDAAIALVRLLIDNKALPMTGQTGKAGDAKRYEEILAYVDKLTVQLYNDAVTGRLLDVVVDAGADRVSTKADGQIPEAGDKSESSVTETPATATSGAVTGSNTAQAGTKFDDSKF